jgi:hypothetical protein
MVLAILWQNRPGHAQRLVTLHQGEVWMLLATEQLVQAAAPRVRCPECGGAMVVVGFVPRLQVRLRELQSLGC